MTFDLGCNEIGTLGAQYLGDLLAKNRVSFILFDS